MEDLQGGTLALEHRYDLERRAREFALVGVYSGTQQPFDRPVWVKVCEAPSLYNAPAMYDRIKRALVSAAAFEHPQAARVVDFGDIDANLGFWVVERAEGVPLDEYLERHGTLAPEEATEIALRVARVVQAAHRAGLHHGGIAPRWISIADDGVIVDHFGIQPSMEEVRQLEGVILSQDLLWSLPPEQFQDEELDAERGDVWALGALLYWMLAGVHPFLDDPTDTSEALLRMRSQTTASAPSLTELGFEADLSAVVAAALEANPADRPSLREFIDAAEGISASEEALEPPAADDAEIEASDAQPTRRGPAQGGVGTALALVIALLILSNLAWMFVGTSRETTAPEALPANTPDVLPVGVELRTAPEGAKILRVTGSTESEYGDTPLTLDPKAVPEESLGLIVRKRGHRDVRMDVAGNSDGHTIILHLAPDGEQASTTE